MRVTLQQKYLELVDSMRLVDKVHDHQANNETLHFFFVDY